MDKSLFSDILLDLSPHIVFFLDADNILCKTSKVAREYFNIQSSQEIEGKSIFELIKTPVFLSLLKKWIEKLNKGMEVDEVIPVDRFSSDQYEWFQVQAVNVSQEGHLTGKVFYISLVTELYSQKKILDTLMSSIPGEILVFDRNLQIMLVSDSVARSNGYHSWRDLAGCSLRDLKRLDLEAIETALEKNILFDEPIHQVEKYVNPKNEIGWNYVDLRTIKSTAGTFGFIMTKFDITGEIKPKAILEALMDSASDAIAIINPEGIIEYASRSLVKTLGFENWNSLVNHPWNYLLQHSATGMAKYAEVFSGDWTQSKKGTISFDSVEGKTFFNYRMDPLDYQGENFGLITIASNTTELVEARDKAELAVRAKAAFLANMSHELRTPMNAVLGMNELLSQTGLNSLQNNYVSHVRSSATMLLTIINDILDFSRIEDGKMVLSKTTYDFNSLLLDVITLIAVKVAEKELSFTVDLDPEIPSILIGDEIRIKQILINLLNNAVKFTPQGEVNLSVLCQKSADQKWANLVFLIKDTGIGIPKNKQVELFERFFQIENKQNPSVEGTGLGLSICKGLVSLMNGKLTLESNEGVGSVFTVELSQKIAAESPPIATFTHPGTVYLLVFETDKNTLASLRKMTEMSGIKTDFCSTYAQFSASLDSKTATYTHVVFEYKTGYPKAFEIIAGNHSLKWLGLLSLTDFIGKEKEPRIDLVFKPLVLSVFARFIEGVHVDFNSSIPLMNPFGHELDSFHTAGSTVLVVDDNAVNRKVAEGFLHTLSITVDEAESGEEAIEKAAQKQYDLILMDHMMPIMDGVDAAIRIRKLSGYKTTPIIALTANAGSYYSDLYKKAGINDSLYKPIEVTAFIACLKKWLPNENQKIIESSPAELWIAGLDKDSGIGYTGSQKNLDMILKVFNRSGPKMLDQLEEGKKSDDPLQFRIAAHSLISSAANIGALELSARSRELEQAILEGKTESCNKLYTRVHDELEKIIAGVAQYTSKQK